MKYRQITSEERYTLSALRKQGLSVTQIAKALGRHRSTIYREIKRNLSPRKWCYRPFEADSMSRGRRRRSRRNRHYTHEDFKVVRHLLRKRWSPEQIVGYIRRHNLMTRRLSHETIYQYVWRDKANGGSLWVYLRQSIKRRRKRYKAYDSRGRLADKRHISERPMSVETRKYRGHWEIDTVVSRASKDCIVTMNERKSGYVMIGKLKDRTSDSLNKKVIDMIDKSPMQFKTITADNGTEFNKYKDIEAQHDVRFFFANPYHSWERGSNENLNGLIRQYIPRGQSMASLSQQQCDRIAEQLNTRPRKRYKFKTPEDIYYGN